MKINFKLLKAIRSIATIGVLMYGAYYVYMNWESFRVLLKVNRLSLGVMLVFLLFTIFASASENAVLYQAAGAPIGNIESFRLTNVSAFFNLIFPQGGSLTKAIYLKQKYGIPYTKTSAIFLGLLLIYLDIGAAVMLVTNFATVLLGGTVPLVLWVIALIACASSLFFMFDFPKFSLFKLGKIGELISSFSDGWNSLRTNKSHLAKACIWQLVTFVCSGLWISTAYYSLGIKLNPLLGISLSVLITFSNILVLIPGNLGIQEAAYGYFTYLSGMMFSQGVVVSALARVVVLMVTLLLTPLSWYYLFYKQNISLSREKFAALQ